MFKLNFLRFIDFCNRVIPRWLCGSDDMIIVKTMKCSDFQLFLIIYCVNFCLFSIKKKLGKLYT